MYTPQQLRKHAQQQQHNAHFDKNALQITTSGRTVYTRITQLKCSLKGMLFIEALSVVETIRHCLVEHTNMTLASILSCVRLCNHRKTQCMRVDSMQTHACLHYSRLQRGASIPHTHTSPFSSRKLCLCALALRVEVGTARLWSFHLRVYLLAGNSGNSVRGGNSELKCDLRTEHSFREGCVRAHVRA